MPTESATSTGTILITGGAGFIGSHLARHLLDTGHRIIVMDNLLTGADENLSGLGDRDLLFIEHDVSNYMLVGEPIDAVLHFASPASPSDYLRYPIQTLKVGAMGTHNALGLARAKGATFMLASTRGSPASSTPTARACGSTTGARCRTSCGRRCAASP